MGKAASLSRVYRIPPLRETAHVGSESSALLVKVHVSASSVTEWRHGQCEEVENEGGTAEESRPFLGRVYFFHWVLLSECFSE